MIYKLLHGLAPPPLSDFIKQRASGDPVTRSIARGGCELPLKRTAVGQNVLSYKGSKLWNSLPLSVRDAPALLHLRVFWRCGYKQTRSVTMFNLFFSLLLFLQRGYVLYGMCNFSSTIYLYTVGQCAIINLYTMAQCAIYHRDNMQQAI